MINIDFPVNRPRLVTPNLITEPEKMRQFAADNGFDGIDWSFDMAQLPSTPAEESGWVGRQELLKPFEVRYHCPFSQVDIGHEDPDIQASAMDIFRRMIRLVSKARRKYLTIHVGLGHDTTKILSWESTIQNLRKLVRLGREAGVTICLENLAWGWSSKPNLFEKLVRRSGASVTFDLGHAYSCESVMSKAYAIKDFVSPHSDRVVNAHIYHQELPELGHLPPERLDDISYRLNLLKRTPCYWWVLELKIAEDLLKTRTIVEDYLKRLKEKFIRENQ